MNIIGYKKKITPPYGLSGWSWRVWAAGSLGTVNEGCVGAQLAPGRAEAASRVC